MEIVPAPESDHDDDALLRAQHQEVSSEKKIDKNLIQMGLLAQSETHRDVPPLIKKTPSSRTKIFIPNESIFNSTTTSPPLKHNIVSSNMVTEKRNAIIYRDNTERRSAFIVPAKSNLLERQVSLLDTLHTMPISSLDTDTTLPTNYRKRKRSSYVNERNAIAYCCCGSHNCKVKVVDYASEDSEGESSYSHDSGSPIDNKASSKPFLMSRSSNPIDSYDFLNEELLYRREDYRDREESQFFNLEKNLGMKLDPFMGYNDANPMAIDDFLNESAHFRT